MNTSIPTIDKVEAWPVPVWTFPAPLAPRLCGSQGIPRKQHVARENPVAGARWTSDAWVPRAPLQIGPPTGCDGKSSAKRVNCDRGLVQ